MEMSVQELYNYLVIDSELKLEDPEIALLFELADLINSGYHKARIVASMIYQSFAKGKSDQRLRALRVVEFLTKNCDGFFHQFLLTKQLCELFLKMLEKRRGMITILNPLVSNKKQIQRKIEDKLLFLIQIWADTFMMHEDQFKPIMDTYKLLRKENVAFPARDPKNKNFVKFEGEISPVFDSVAEGQVYEETKKQLLCRTYKVKEEQFFPEEKNKTYKIEKTTPTPKSVEISLEDLPTIAETIELLYSMLESVESIKDLNSKVIRQHY